MADPLDALTPKQRAIIKQLGDLEVSLENGMAGALPKVFATLSRDVQRVAANLSLDPNDRAKTLRELIGLKRKMGDLVVNNKEYQREVLKLTNEFKTIKNLTDQFIGSTMDDFEPTRKLYNAILESNIAITKDALLGGGIVDNFGNAIQEVLKANIAGVSDRATLMETLAKFIEGTPQRKAYLENYIKQTTNDSLMVFNREYLQTISEDLGMRHYLYQGTIIGDTRQFCQSRAGKYFTKEEVEKWASQTWDGKMAGTNSTTIFSYAGGYNCRHKIWPVTEEQYNRAKGITPPAATPPSPPVVAPPPPGIPPQMTAPPVLPKPLPTPKPPKQPIQKSKTMDELIAEMNDIYTNKLGVKVKSIEFDPSISIEKMQVRVNQLNKLADTYKLGDAVDKNSPIKFSMRSGGGAYGLVRHNSSFLNKKMMIQEVNFGHRFDEFRIPGNMKSSDFKPKSSIFNGSTALMSEAEKKVIADKLEVSTLTHEFAHFISLSQSSIVKDAQAIDFWDEIKKLNSKYKREIRKDILAANSETNLLTRTQKKAQVMREYLGDYAQTNLNEFFAEAFTEFNLNDNPSKWALEVKRITNKYFKK